MRGKCGRVGGRRVGKGVGGENEGGEGRWGRSRREERRVHSEENVQVHVIHPTYSCITTIPSPWIAH